MSTSSSRLSMRLPDDLAKKLDDAIKTSGKTLTAEIIERLNLSFTIEQNDGSILSDIRSLMLKLKQLETKILTPETKALHLDNSIETALLQLDDVDSNNIKSLILRLASKKT
jgi:metal-responsive CopG/Arc/MetJ family transcriptional regulator